MKRLLREKRNTMANKWGLCVCTLFLGVFAGCGGAERSDSSVVSPPPAGPIDNAAPTEVEPPGEIVMPAGEIQLPTEDEPPQSEGGIQMPQDAKVPDAKVPDAGVPDAGVPDADAPAPAESTSTEGPSAPADSDSSATIDLQYGTWEEIESLAKSSGRITVVDLWSLACEPCLKEFPGLVRLHQTLGSSVQCIAVDLDFDGRKSRPPERYEDQVLSFVRGVGASGFPIYISRTPSDDVFAATKLNSIPAVLIYTAEGELAKAFVDTGETAGFTYDDDVIPLVTKMAG